MTSDRTTIRAVAEVFDGPHATPKKTKVGPYFLSISSLEGGHLDLSKSAHLTEDQFKTWTRRVTPEAGDVLFSYETRLGEAALMPPGVQACLGRRMGLLRPRRKKVIPEYLLYAYIAPPFQEEIRKRTIHGATVERIALKELPGFPIRIPDLGEQRFVVGFLQSLDSKIELNRRMNRTLEAMAQAIFKSWFVDFEPVKAKAAAKAAGASPAAVERAAMAAIAGRSIEEAVAQEGYFDDLTPSNRASLAQTAALFPDEFQGSEFGEIPEGWEPRTLSNLLELAYGKALKKSDRKPGPYPVYGSGGITGYHNSSIVSGPGIIVGRKGTVGSLYWEDECFFPIDTVFYVLPREGYSLEFLYYLLQTLGLDEMNTDAAVPGLNRNNTYRLEVPAVRVELVSGFSNVVSTFRAKIRDNTAESRTLAELRDTLLPKLLSGEVTVPEAESQPEDVDV